MRLGPIPPPVRSRTDSFSLRGAYRRPMASDDGDGSVPVDLLAVATLAVVAVLAAAAAPPSLAPARYVFAVVALLLPGYAVVAALFPRGPLGPDDPPGRPAERASRLDGFERLVLSVAAGLLVTPLVGIAVDFTPLGYFQLPVLLAVTGFVLVAVAVAAYRRRTVPAAERYVPHRRWRRALERVRGGHPTTGSAVVTVAVAVAVVVAAGGVFTVVTTADTGEQFTEFALLAESDGNLTLAGSYPETVSVGEEIEVVLTVENRERRPQTYTVVPRLQRVVEGPEGTRVVESEAFDRVRVPVADGRTERRALSVSPTLTGDALRLSFLLYRGSPPETMTTTNAYRRTHIWVNVTAPAGTPVPEPEPTPAPAGTPTPAPAATPTSAGTPTPAPEGTPVPPAAGTQTPDGTPAATNATAP